MRFPSRSWFTLGALFLVAAVLLETGRLGRLAGLVPLWVALPTLVLLVLELALECFPDLARAVTSYERVRLKRAEALRERTVSERATTGPGGTSHLERVAILWTLALLVAVLVLGFVIGGALFVVASLWVRAGVPWWKSILVGCITALVLSLFSGLLHNPLHAGWLW